MSALTFNRALAALLIAGIGVHQFVSFRRTPGVEEYHARVRAAADIVPTRIGAWVGQDVPVPVQALTVLRPNVLISRRFTNIETGATAVLLIVHCADAHSMVGHFPGRCYPAEGWQLQRTTDRDWTIGDLHLPGVEYEFIMDPPAGSDQAPQNIIVANCLLRPGGRVFRDMTALSDSILGADGQSTGAGQLQVVFDATVPLAQRDAAFTALAAGYRPVLDAILSRPGHN